MNFMPPPQRFGIVMLIEYDIVEYPIKIEADSESSNEHVFEEDTDDDAEDSKFEWTPLKGHRG